MRLSEVGFTPALHAMLQSALTKPGLVLVCGSTGSGKTDSAKALVREAASLGRDVVSIDESSKTDTRSIVDAGDLREVFETLRAVELAATSLVVGVLRSGEGPNVINRLVDMGADPARLRSQSIWLVTQRLANSLCVACRIPQPTNKSAFLAAGLKEDAWHLSGGYVYGAQGCTACDGGLRGNCVLAEGFASEKVAPFRQVGSIMNHATLRVLSGQITLEEARRLI